MNYRNNLEAKIAKTLPAGFQYEAKRLPYTVEASYLPDFIDEQAKEIIEVKGLFDAADRRKMRCIREQYPHYKITIIFQRPQTSINKGSKTTYSDWCEKHGINWRQA